MDEVEFGELLRRVDCLENDLAEAKSDIDALRQRIEELEQGPEVVS